MNDVRKQKEASNGVGSGELVLHLPLTHHWYDETERGAKCIEYRVMIPRWEKQIWQRRVEITHVRFSRGYTSRTLTRPVERIDIGPCPIPGWGGDYYRIHFSPNTKISHEAKTRTNSLHETYSIENENAHESRTDGLVAL